MTIVVKQRAQRNGKNEWAGVLPRKYGAVAASIQTRIVYRADVTQQTPDENQPAGTGSDILSFCLRALRFGVPAECLSGAWEQIEQSWVANSQALQQLAYEFLEGCDLHDLINIAGGLDSFELQLPNIRTMAGFTNVRALLEYWQLERSYHLVRDEKISSELSK